MASNPNPGGPNLGSPDPGVTAAPPIAALAKAVEMDPNEARSLGKSTLSVIAFLLVGISVLLVSIPTYDYLQAVGLKGYSSAGTLGQMSPDIDAYLKTMRDWNAKRRDLYNNIIEEQRAIPSSDNALYLALSSAKSFLRDNADAAFDSKTAGGSLTFDGVIQGFQTYCAKAGKAACAPASDAQTKRQAVIDAQQKSTLAHAQVDYDRKALTDLNDAEATFGLTSLKVKDKDNLQLLLEAHAQRKYATLPFAFTLPLVVQYLFIAFCFGAVGGYFRYIGDLFSTGTTVLRRVGGVAINGGGAALLVLVLSLAGVQLVTLGAGQGNDGATPNPMFVSGLSLVAGVASNAILSSVAKIAGKILN